MNNKKNIILWLWTWGSVLIAIISAAKTAWELYTLVGDAGQNLEERLLAIFWWFLVFVVMVAIALAQREFELHKIKKAKPIIKLKDFGFEIKTWKDKYPTITAYIRISNTPNTNAIADTNIYRLFPTITWEDEEGNEVANNSGRWFIVNGDEEKKIDMQVVDLESNGMPRKLHFASSDSQSKLIETLWRDDGGITHTKVLRTSDRYKVSISLRDNKNTTAKFIFRISLYKINEHPFTALKLEIYNDKEKKFIDAKSFDFKNLDEFIKENPKSIPEFIWKT